MQLTLIHTLNAKTIIRKITIENFMSYMVRGPPESAKEHRRQEKQHSKLPVKVVAIRKRMVAEFIMFRGTVKE